MSGDVMMFPDTWEEFEEDYGFTDKEEIYTNGSRLIPSFRVEQWLEHIEHKTSIVQCKDCKHLSKSQWVTNLDGTEKRCKCDCIGGYMLERNFCSFGERSDDE